MRRRVRARFLVALGLSVGAWLSCPVRPAVVLGGSMEPTLHSGQVVLVNRRHYQRQEIQRGDIVAFHHDGMAQIKRVLALPGDSVWEIRYDNSDSVFLADPGVLEETRQALAYAVGAKLTETRVPPGTLYLLGDGGNASYDSRNYGPVPVDSLIGRVVRHELSDLPALQARDRATLWLTRHAAHTPSK